MKIRVRILARSAQIIVLPRHPWFRPFEICVASSASILHTISSRLPRQARSIDPPRKILFLGTATVVVRKPAHRNHLAVAKEIIRALAVNALVNATLVFKPFPAFDGKNEVAEARVSIGVEALARSSVGGVAAVSVPI